MNLKAFRPQDHASDLKDLDLGSDMLPTQRSLGLNGSLKSDTFTFEMATEAKPFTCRGVLSIINSIYDPLGFVAPVTIQGKFIMRVLNNQNEDWDSPLPKEMEEKWDMWRLSLKDLSKLQIPRSYTNNSLCVALEGDVFVFSDASTKAIAAVAYLRFERFIWNQPCRLHHG